MRFNRQKVQRVRDALDEMGVEYSIGDKGRLILVRKQGARVALWPSTNTYQFGRGPIHKGLRGFVANGLPIPVTENRSRAVGDVCDDVRCPDCDAPMVLRQTFKHRYPKSGKPRKFYGCSNYPQCKSAHGAHPDGRPLGVPADSETKKWRSLAHRSMDALMAKEGWSEKEMYEWLRKAMRLSEEECHVGRFGIDECRRVMSICELGTIVKGKDE